LHTVDIPQKFITSYHCKSYIDLQLIFTRFILQMFIYTVYQSFHRHILQKGKWKSSDIDRGPFAGDAESAKEVLAWLSVISILTDFLSFSSSFCRKLYLFKCYQFLGQRSEDFVQWVCLLQIHSLSLIIFKIQECPNCHSAIEKDGGCNHIICKQCKFDFCWVCLTSWQPHGSSW